MSSPLADVWEAAAASPFQPAIGKDSQFAIGFALLFASLLLTGFFGLSTSTPRPASPATPAAHSPTDRSLANLPLVGAPASIAFGFGAVLMICAVGVYV
ncbi:DNA repair protein [Stagonosporopsis vannaccii]|nr:DNA repair protein [Stagonosporopsis vannaccii]